jgi:hypothetical protein
MTTAELQDLFSTPPASLVWSQSDDGQRTIGASEGFALDIWPDRVVASALMPPDRPDLAARNGTLLELLLLALRSDWQTASAWLAQQLRLASRHANYDGPNYTRRVKLLWSRQHSRVTLKVMT